jgi:hypothetical protein
VELGYQVGVGGVVVGHVGHSEDFGIVVDRQKVHQIGVLQKYLVFEGYVDIGGNWRHKDKGVANLGVVYGYLKNYNKDTF